MTHVLDRALGVSVHLLGVAAFLWPFLVPAAGAAEVSARASDAPWLFTALGALLVGVAVADVRAGRMSTKHLALLGVLAGVNAVLRLPGAFGGASLMFVLPILAGASFGARFGFLLGSMSMAASAVITGGIGPWLPFQMWALGWLGAGGGLLRPVARRRGGVLVLAAYGWLAGLLFGALVNLWFWPFQSGASALAWQPGIGAGEAAARYWRFYLVTSLAWDATRAVANALLIGVVGRPVLRTLRRYRARAEVRWSEPAPVAGSMTA